MNSRKHKRHLRPRQQELVDLERQRTDIRALNWGSEL